MVVPSLINREAIVTILVSTKLLIAAVYFVDLDSIWVVNHDCSHRMTGNNRNHTSAALGYICTRRYCNEGVGFRMSLAVADKTSVVTSKPANGGHPKTGQ